MTGTFFILYVQSFPGYESIVVAFYFRLLAMKVRDSNQTSTTGIRARLRCNEDGSWANLCRSPRHLAIPILYRRPNESRDSRLMRANFPTFSQSKTAALRCRDLRAIPTCALRRSAPKQVENIYPLACVEGGGLERKRERDDERDILARALRNGPVLMDSRTWYEVLPDFAWPVELFLIQKLHQLLYRMFQPFLARVKLNRDRARKKIITVKLSQI